MELNGGGQNQLTHLQTTPLWKNCQVYTAGQDGLFNQRGWKNWIRECKRTQLDPFLMPHTTVSSRWIPNSTVRPGTVKLLEENRGEAPWHWSWQFFGENIRNQN